MPPWMRIASVEFSNAASDANSLAIAERSVEGSRAASWSSARAAAMRVALERQLEEPSAEAARPPPIPDHVLLQRIGGGAYGDVWLARNALGTLRLLTALRPAHGTAVVCLHLVYHCFHPFQMPRGEHQEEVGVLRLQATIDRQQHRFFTFMGTAGHQQAPTRHQGSQGMWDCRLCCRQQRAIDVRVASHVHTLTIRAKVLQALGPLLRLDQE